MQANESKRKWIRPKMLVLLRKTEERILESCKSQFMCSCEIAVPIGKKCPSGFQDRGICGFCGEGSTCDPCLPNWTVQGCEDIYPPPTHHFCWSKKLNNS